jgi:hypothetical protein
MRSTGSYSPSDDEGRQRMSSRPSCCSKSTGQECLHRRQVAWTPTTHERPLRQLTHGDERDREYVTCERLGERIRGSAAEKRGSDVGVDDDEAHLMSARRDA